IHSSILLVYSQPNMEWVRTYNSPENVVDHFIDMATDPFGNVHVTGWITTPSQSSNIITIKYNSSGVLQWATSYNGAGNSGDVSNGLAVDSLGNCYIAGYTGFNFGAYDGILIKYNTSGDTLWTRKLETPHDDDFTSVAIDRNNFVFVTGRSGDSALVFKYDSTGGMIWRAKYYEPPYLSLAGKIRFDRLNNVYVGGTKHVFSNLTSPDFLVRKYTPSGSQVWVSTYNSPNNVDDWMTGFVVDNSGNSYSTGYSSSTSSRDILTVKFNANGSFGWAKFYNGVSDATDQGNAIACDTSGNNIFITGETYVTGSSTNYITIKNNNSGDTLWTRTYNGPGNYQDNAMDITLDNLLNVYVTGESSMSGFDFDVATIKYGLNGNQQWVARWASPGGGGDGGYRILVDYQHNVYIGGGAGVPGPNFLDLLTIKYSQPI